MGIFYLLVTNDGAKRDLSELLLLERPVRDASNGCSILANHNGAVPAVEHEANDVLLWHLGQLCVKYFLRKQKTPSARSDT